MVKKKNNLLIIIIIVVAFIIFGRDITFRGALVTDPALYTYWPDANTCSFITNTDSVDTWSSFSDFNTWITYDYNNDGTKDLFGMTGAVSPPTGGFIAKCRTDATSIFENINAEGVDIYYDDSGAGAGVHRLYICREDDTKAYVYTLNNIEDPPIGEPVYDCGQCVSDCAGKVCGDDGCGNSCGTCDSGFLCSNNQCIEDVCVPKTTCDTHVCGEESDGCGGFVPCGTCAGGETCVSGVCQTSQCTVDDINYGWTEINQAISKWLGG